MKIIEAMKEIKRLQEKAADLQKKVAQHCADLDFETPAYPDQRRQIDEWLQSHTDTVQRIAQLRVAIQKTNIETSVSIELGGKHVSKSIAEWVHRRRDLAKMDLTIWSMLTDRNLKEGMGQQTSGQTVPIRIRRHFDPTVRDQKQALYRDEPSLIDAQLEVTNAVTEVIGL